MLAAFPRGFPPLSAGCRAWSSIPIHGKGKQQALHLGPSSWRCSILPMSIDVGPGPTFLTPSVLPTPTSAAGLCAGCSTELGVSGCFTLRRGVGP